LSIKGHTLTIKVRLAILVKNKVKISRSEADRVAELSSNALATGHFLPISDHPAHNHASKVIAENMPLGGYGKLVLIHHEPTTMTKTHEDDYYAFEETAYSSTPTRISLSSFVDSSDYLKDLLRPSDNAARGVRAEPSVVLSSERSGLKLEFDTNRRWNS
jgi:aldose 1-epimerase